VQALGRPDLKAILDLIALPTYFGIAWWLTKRNGINGAAFAKLLVTAADCAFLYLFAFKLKAFSLRDCVSGPLFRAISVSGALFALVFAVASLHLKVSLDIPAIVLCFIAFVLMFWRFAVDQEDRNVLDAFRKKAFGIVARRRTPGALPVTGSDAAL
jgi:O-antigen/teichoic acid export membrane protein